MICFCATFPHSTEFFLTSRKNRRLKLPILHVIWLNCDHWFSFKHTHGNDTIKNIDNFFMWKEYYVLRIICGDKISMALFLHRIDIESKLANYSLSIHFFELSSKIEMYCHSNRRFGCMCECVNAGYWMRLRIREWSRAFKVLERERESDGKR